MRSTPPATPIAGAFSFRDIALPAYGPTIVNAIGHGAVMPVLALRARELGADVSTAAMVVAALSLGMLVASLPAGAVVARLGERRSLMICGVLDAAAMVLCTRTTSVWALGVLIFCSGITWTAYLIARQGFMIDAVPVHLRARGMSLLGGSFRVGVLIGPLLGAGLITLFGLTSVFWLAAAMSLLAVALVTTMPDLGGEARAQAKQDGILSVRQVLTRYRRPLLTVGSSVLVISASRSIRASLLPLWAEHIGLSAATTSLIFAFASALDVIAIYPGGWLMDHRGRRPVAIAVVASAAVACLLLPLATHVVSLAAVMGLMAVGNGLGSGIVMTLGADTAPEIGRAQYLGGWRLCGDFGNSGGPLLVSALAGLAPLAVACLGMGAVLAAGTGWVSLWTRRVDAARAQGGPLEV